MNVSLSSVGLFVFLFICNHDYMNIWSFDEVFIKIGQIMSGADFTKGLKSRFRLKFKTLVLIFCQKNVKSVVLD